VRKGGSRSVAFLPRLKAWASCDGFCELLREALHEVFHDPFAPFFTSLLVFFLGLVCKDLQNVEGRDTTLSGSNGGAGNASPSGPVPLDVVPIENYVATPANAISGCAKRSPGRLKQTSLPPQHSTDHLKQVI